jgi:hypothetical protein
MRRDPRTDPRKGDVAYHVNGTRQLLVDKLDGADVVYRALAYIQWEVE